MKKTVTTIVVLFCAFQVSFGATDIRTSTIKPAENSEYDLISPPAINGNLTVAKYGFLSIPSVEDLEEYLKYVSSSTHGEVQKYNSELGFSSLGAELYREEFLNQQVTEEQAMDYVFNRDRIFQLQKVVMKPIGEVGDCPTGKWQFILAMMETVLTEDTYEKLTAGEFDGHVMNKFSGASQIEGDFFTFMETTPNGFETNEPTPCPPDIDCQARRFLGTGWGPVHVPPNAPFLDYIEGCGCGGWIGYREYTILWIIVRRGDAPSCALCVN